MEGVTRVIRNCRVAWLEKLACTIDFGWFFGFVGLPINVYVVICAHIYLYAINLLNCPLL